MRHYRPGENRRTPLIEAALEPARKQFKPAALKTLSRALALIIGTEAMVVFKDVLQLDDAETRKVKRWAIRALVDGSQEIRQRPARRGVDSGDRSAWSARQCSYS